MVNSSLHKPSADDMRVMRGVTEHSDWTSQTLKEASADLPLMLPDLASGTERKCCRTRRGHRPSWPQSGCQLADCGRKESEKKERERERIPVVHQKGNCQRNCRRERSKERAENKGSVVSLPIFSLTTWLLVTDPLNTNTSLLHPSMLRSIPLYSLFP